MIKPMTWVVYDSVELQNFYQETYNERLNLGEALDHPADGSIHDIEMYYNDEELDVVFTPSFAALLRKFQRLIDDGHIPKQDEYKLYIWW